MFTTNDELIENILLCDPVTERGRKKLKDLGLSGEISPKVFFESLWAKPTYETDREFIENGSEKDDIITYTSRKIELSNIKKRREKLKERFAGSDNGHTTVLMGVVGSGKSVELQRQVFDTLQEHKVPFSYNDNEDEEANPDFITSNAVLLDLEYSEYQVHEREKYKCPDPSSPLWLFCTKILATLINYIRFLHIYKAEALLSAKANYRKYFDRGKDYEIYGTSEEADKLFDSLYEYASNPDVGLPVVFKTICSMLKSGQGLNASEANSEEFAENDIMLLLDFFFIIMFCASPSEKKVILVDNVEDYITVKGSGKIAISNKEVQSLYQILKKQAKNNNTMFGKAKTVARKDAQKDPKQPAVCGLPIIIAIRRTTWELFETTCIGDREPYSADIFDITGDVQIVDIWDKKYSKIWIDRLLPNSNSETKKLIDVADFIMRDDETENGTGFQISFSKIMSRGLRRMGHNESIALYDLFCGREHGLLCSSGLTYMNYDTFYKIRTKKSASSYMLRRGLEENYYKYQILRTDINGDPIGNRWKDLYLGSITAAPPRYLLKSEGKPNIGDRKQYLNIIGYVGRSANYRTLLRRILSKLSKYPDNDRTSVCVAPIYKTISLYKLMEGIFVAPNDQEVNVSDEAFEQLATVLLAASKPEVEGEYSPLVLLRVHHEDGTPFDYTKKETFASLLKKIWHDGPDESADDDRLPYCWKKCGVRINEAGAEFLFVQQPGYCRFSGFYNCNFPPLFFIRSTKLITHALWQVYDSADKECTAFEEETRLFLQTAGCDALDERYMPKDDKNEIWPYRKLVKKHHLNYLERYAEFILKTWEDLGMSDSERDLILSEIDKVTRKYKDWGCELQCF